MTARLSILTTAAALLATASVAVAQGQASDEPPLPEGLEEQEEPALPEGLDGEDEPGVPEGLRDGDEISVTADGDQAPWLPFDLNGYADIRAGARVVDDPYEERASVGELRVQLATERTWTAMNTAVRVVADAIYDPVLGEHEPQLERGEGAIDLREANVVVSPTEFADIKLGRQILTWGAGDLLFVNDLFPKDWNALLVGRDLAYLKAPSDAVKVSLFSELVNVDVVYTPRFDADRYPDRRRVSSWDPMLDRIAGGDSLVLADRPNTWFGDDELALRLHRHVGRYEVAAYGYHGRWKSPAGFDPLHGVATFPLLSVYGASARGPFGGGIAYLEGGYYDSRDDRGATDPLIRDSETRVLAGYERELGPLLTLGVQYYAEIADRDRHVVTLRLTWRAMAERLRATLFAFVSPSDRDIYLRPQLTYAIDDHWRAELGGNVFFGASDDTFFGQFRYNTNAYAGARYGW